MKTKSKYKEVPLVNRKYLDVYLISSLYGSVGIVGVVDFQDLVVTKLEI